MEYVALVIISTLVIVAVIFNWRAIVRWGKWVDIHKEVEYEFMYRKCTRYDYGNYRFIPNTEIVQEFTYDSQGGSWSQLSKCESKAILDNIYKENDKWLFRKK